MALSDIGQAVGQIEYGSFFDKAMASGFSLFIKHPFLTLFGFIVVVLLVSFVVSKWFDDWEGQSQNALQAGVIYALIFGVGFMVLLIIDFGIVFWKLST